MSLGQRVVSVRQQRGVVPWTTACAQNINCTGANATAFYCLVASLFLRGNCECVFRLPLPKSVETRNTKSSTQNYVQIHGTRTKLTHSMVQVYLDKD